MAEFLKSEREVKGTKQENEISKWNFFLAFQGLYQSPPFFHCMAATWWLPNQWQSLVLPRIRLSLGQLGIPRESPFIQIWRLAWDQIVNSPSFDCPLLNQHNGSCVLGSLFAPPCLLCFSYFWFVCEPLSHDWILTCTPHIAVASSWFGSLDLFLYFI